MSSVVQSLMLIPCRTFSMVEWWFDYATCRHVRLA
jgi:hypothetical protein